MTAASVFSGIGAPESAWIPLGIEFVFNAEIEPFPCAVLRHHYPTTPNLGDVTKFEEWNYATTFDILVGGSPCQSFSLAGLRKGLDDPRGNLMLVFGAIAARYRTDWVVWENVPGVLSSNGGRDFASFLGLLTGQQVKVPVGGWRNSGILSGINSAYGVAWRILDAQYLGVAQRRRRVFVVGHIGAKWQRASAVLLERQSLCGDSAPGREAGENVAPTISARTNGGGGLGTDFDLDGGLISETFRMTAFGEYSDDGSSSSMKMRDYKDATDLVVESDHGIPGNWIGRKPENGGNAVQPMFEIAPNFTKTDRHGVQNGRMVRRLTPAECERLQGFPEGYTQIIFEGKPACDTPRYKALGNSMAVPVLKWIGKRIIEVDKIP